MWEGLWCYSVMYVALCLKFWALKMIRNLARRYQLFHARLPELVRECFHVIEERHWEWITDLPGEGKLGRGYEVVGYVLKTEKLENQNV